MQDFIVLFLLGRGIVAQRRKKHQRKQRIGRDPLRKNEHLVLKPFAEVLNRLPA
jgi:hypothetical protein